MRTKGTIIAIAAVGFAALRPADGALGDLTFESEGEMIRIGNANCNFDKGNFTGVSTATITLAIPDDAFENLPAGEFVRLDSLDFGFTEDHWNYGYTHARHIAIDVDGYTYVSSRVSTNKTDVFTSANGASAYRLEYSFEDEPCFLSPGTPCTMRFLDGGSNTMNTVRYGVGENAKSIIDGLSFSANGKVYRPLFQMTGTHYTRKSLLNGEEQSVADSIGLIRLFGAGAADGVAFRICGIDVSEGSLRLDVSPAPKDGNSLSVMARRDFGNRWRRVKVNPQGASVRIDDADLAGFRFFHIRAEKGKKKTGYLVSTEATMCDKDNTDSESNITSAKVNGDTRLFSLSFSDGEAADFASDDYKTLTMQLAGVRPGTSVRLAVDGETFYGEVEPGGTVSFSGLPAMTGSSVLAMDIVGDEHSDAIDATVLSERAGVVSVKWGDDGNSLAEPVDGGVTNTMTMLANRPAADGFGTGTGGWFRIPAMAKSTNGTIVALYDCRLKSSGDLPNAIDWSENWSGDNGATWTRPKVAVDVPNNGEQTVGRATDITDPCILYDPRQDRFFAMGITGKGLNGGNAVNSDVVMYVRGTGRDDAWVEWAGGPDGCGRSVQQMILDSLAAADPSASSDTASIIGILEGPGHGIVQRRTVADGDGKTIMPAGALVFPMQYFPSGTTYKTHNFAAYSTDGGATWQATCLTPAKTPDGEDCYAHEGSIVELDDGTWEYMGKFGNASVDAIGPKLFFRTRDFKTWTFDGYHYHQAVRCQGSCLWLGEAVKARFGSSRYAACFSTWGDYGAGKRRGGIKLFIGRDTSSEPNAPGITWDCGEIDIRPEHTSACAYNSMVMLDDWTIGILFEAFGHIYFRKVDLCGVLSAETGGRP